LHENFFDQLLAADMEKVDMDMDTSAAGHITAEVVAV
jgi:hypothetical protein